MKYFFGSNQDSEPDGWAQAAPDLRVWAPGPGTAHSLMLQGFAAGRIPTLAANHVLIKGYSVVGVRAGEWLRQRPADAPGIRAELARLADAGVFRPLVGATFPLARAKDALAALARREAPGKIVVEID